jgi:hypothetical protein
MEPKLLLSGQYTVNAFQRRAGFSSDLIGSLRFVCSGLDRSGLQSPLLVWMKVALALFKKIIDVKP